MRKLLTLVLGVAACFGASAQYISLQQGTTLEYKSTLYQDKDSMTLNTVVQDFKCYRGRRRYHRSHSEDYTYGEYSLRRENRHYHHCIYRCRQVD